MKRFFGERFWAYSPTLKRLCQAKKKAWLCHTESMWLTLNPMHNDHE